MKTFKQYTVLSLLKVLGILFLTILISSCSKDGAIGPKGDTGAQGASGVQGSQGIPGKEGSVILTGAGAPSTVGNNGDMYLDKSTSNLYGPKTASGWGTPLSLKGENGSVGVSGSAILNGTTVPTTVGVNGDYYLNKTNADLYGPKTAAGWGTPLNLKGSAKVIASSWMNLKMWKENLSNNYVREADYEIPTPILNAVGYSSLGAMIEEGGALNVYFSRNEIFYPVASMVVMFGIPYYLNWSVWGQFENKFRFNVERVDRGPMMPELLNTPGNGTFKIRYVLIPASSQFSGTANLKNMSYEQVKDLLSLKD
jgi:hypothetical protein